MTHQQSYTVEPPASFHRRVDRSAGPAACWPWRGGRHPSGYGIVSIRLNGRARVAGAHQLANYLATGVWEARAQGRLVRHLCHNPVCCNPDHLAGGTPLDNSADRLHRVMDWPLTNRAGAKVRPHRHRVVTL